MPPPPPPSASYNLKLDDFSSSEDDNEDDDYYNERYNEMIMADATVHHANGYLPTASMEEDGISNNNVDDIPWAQVVPSSSNEGQTLNNNNYPTVEATNVTTLPSSADASATTLSLLEGEEVEEDEVIKSPPTKKNKKKKKKKKKKKNAAVGNLLNDNAEGGFQVPQAEDGLKDIADSSEPSDLLLATNASKDGITVSTNESSVLNDYENAAAKPKAKAKSTKSISFGTISVREYARTLGEQVVPADGGWPLGLSSKVIAEHPNNNNNNSNTISSSSPRRRSRSRSDSISTTTPVSSPTHSSSSPSSTTPQHYPTSWSIDDFETRRQIELQQRYISLIQQERKRTYEKEWEKKHLHLHSSNYKHGHNTRNRNRSRSRSGSFSSGSNITNNCNSNSSGGRSNSGRSSSSGSMKLEMTSGEKVEMENIINAPISLPEGMLETRPFDYKKKIIRDQQRLLLVKKQGNKNSPTRNHDGNKSLNGNQDMKVGSKQRQGGGSSCATTNNNGQDKVVKQSDDHDDQHQHTAVITEMDELYHKHGGRNPLFMPMKEDERRRVLLRDYDHVMKYCSFIDNDDDDDNFKSSQQKQPPLLLLDPTDTSITQHIQHDLETLRIQRTDPTNLGCSCRKLHVFLPGSTDKSHHKKKGSHRRLPERKVKEELRRRGLINKGNENMSREKMEVLLHDAIENEPCCWGNDCVCVRNGIGCQADTCSCWHVSHDVAHHHNHTTTTTTNERKNNGGTKNSSSGGGANLTLSNEQQQDVDRMKMRCGNENGLYVVNFYEISKCRQRFVTTGTTAASESANAC